MDKLFIQLHRQQLKAMRTKGISRAAVYVYLELQFYMIGDKIECWPSQQTIADNLDMTPRTVRNAIAQLRDHGLLIVDADKRSTNTYKNGSVEEHEEKVILFEMPTGKSDPVHEEKVILPTGKSDPMDEEKVILLNIDNKDKKEIDKKKERKSNVQEISKSFEVDKRNLWIESLLSQYATSLGWNTNDMIADIETIKKGYSILAVERGCKSLDVFIRDGKKHKLFRGRGWVQGLRTWIGREPTGKLSQSKEARYARSVLTIDYASAEKESQEAIKSVEKSQALALVDQGGVKGLWGALCKRHNMDYQAIEKEVVEMVDDGRITPDMQQEIKRHDDLEIFDALIDIYVSLGSKYNV
ncbi:MAG: helix-turn-helix domain-containing protein [Pseudomonadota bacterium]|nr:helix-turn-helix domain-containing protein [Pseudomonadota bacterium]